MDHIKRIQQHLLPSRMLGQSHLQQRRQQWLLPQYSNQVKTRCNIFSCRATLDLDSSCRLETMIRATAGNMKSSLDLDLISDACAPGFTIQVGITPMDTINASCKQHCRSSHTSRTAITAICLAIILLQMMQGSTGTVNTNNSQYRTPRECVTDNWGS